MLYLFDGWLFVSILLVDKRYSIGIMIYISGMTPNPNVKNKLDVKVAIMSLIFNKILEFYKFSNKDIY